MTTKAQRKRAWAEFQKNPTCDWQEPILKDGTFERWQTCERPAVFQFAVVAEHTPFYRCSEHADECRSWGLKAKRVQRPPSCWQDLFHTKEEAENAPPVSFLIKDFLQREGVTAIAAPVRERKSLIALNIAHALLTGEKLFGHFEVIERPERVLYLCPEVSLGPFTDRLRRIGLMDHVGTSLFFRTLSADGQLKLSEPLIKDVLPGSVIFLDTAIRFLEGDENSSSDVRAFADSIFALLRDGAEAVILLHHSPKDSGDTMTLEKAMRGSGDMGAFLASCWGTRLQDTEHPYESASFLSNLKQRDFMSKDFEVTCSEDCRMHYVDGLTAPTLAPRNRFKSDRDGMGVKAEQFIKEHLDLSLRQTVEELEKMGIKRGKDWIGRTKARLSVR